jgi:hypothetical protein
MTPLNDEVPSPPADGARWLMEVYNRLRRGRHIILHGHVRDLVRLQENLVLLRDALDHVLARAGADVRCHYDVVDGTSFSSVRAREVFIGMQPAPPSQGAAFQPLGGGSPPAPAAAPAPAPTPTGSYKAPDLALAAIRRFLTQRSPRLQAAVIHLGDLLLQSSEHRDLTDRQLLGQLQRTLEEAYIHGKAPFAGMRNALILVAASPGTVPAWLYRENPLVELVEIPRPDEADRRSFFVSRGAERGFFGESPGQRSDVALQKRFEEMTAGLSTWDLEALRLTSQAQGISLDDMERLLHMFRFGKREDPWLKVDHAKILQTRAALETEVKGQEAAISAVCDVLMSARTSISIDGAATNRPKGRLFFVGPTGVGKTETARTLARNLFGSDRSFRRFDMSEFQAEHSAERFTGAPPSYIGFEAGGELTNWVRDNPFSVILFDEVDKAHPRVLDRFLQVLDDGRLTDARGQTVSFSQSILIFTSNYGATPKDGDSGPPVTLAMDYAAVAAHFRRAVERHFIDCKRPELLGRIGPRNIIAFDVLRPGVAMSVVRKFTGRLAAAAKERANIDVVFSDSFQAFIERRTQQPSVLQWGARGLKDEIEALEPRLSEAAFILGRPGTVEVYAEGDDIRVRPVT